MNERNATDLGSGIASTGDTEEQRGLIQYIKASSIKFSTLLLRPHDDKEVMQLSKSIKEVGLLQPIIVRLKDGFYEIVAGNRRFTACKALGWRKIPCYVLDLDDKAMFEMALIENVQRKTMTPLEEAESFRRYVEEKGWGSVAELASRIGKSSAYISKRIALLDLPTDVRDRIANNEIFASAAEELLAVKDKEKQSELANMIAARRLTIKKARLLVDQLKRKESFVGNSNSSVIDTILVNNMAIANSAYPPPQQQQECEYDDISQQLNQIARKGYDHLAIKYHKAFDRAIVATKICMNNMDDVLKDAEENWLVYELLLQQRTTLHAMIDILLKERRNLRRMRLYRYIRK
ncbi:ParB/RepB/Spo0J family partition protein [Nitrososphaera viennensis]|uniref:ParB/RepB/Spo0J family partition protein n=2 Tax=Nitrososphaera viennensis TaxID=1034015 RepID=A0A977ICR9_9ARCH|nr:ParB/RepB/Spo0J family partition protein [Nitrososphaera viennensis]AIC16444.1 putative Transcriptional regulator [Nitrososphaera viennensis EN76]UVS68378.1 ParB/RepB/Spo0J family partition protein [Nitrososphaera viennensis]